MIAQTSLGRAFALYYSGLPLEGRLLLLNETVQQ